MKYNGSFVEMTGRDEAAVAVMAQRGVNSLRSKISMAERREGFFDIQDNDLDFLTLVIYIRDYYADLGFIPNEVIDYLLEMVQRGRVYL